MSVCESFSGLLFLAQIYRHTSTPFAYLFVSIQKPPKGWTASSCQGFVVCGSWYICSCKKKKKNTEYIFSGSLCEVIICWDRLWFLPVQVLSGWKRRLWWKRKSRKSYAAANSSTDCSDCKQYKGGRKAAVLLWVFFRANKIYSPMQNL